MSENETQETTKLNDTQKVRLKTLFENYLKTETCKIEFPKYLKLLNDFHCALNKTTFSGDNDDNISNDADLKNILEYLHNDSLIKDKESYSIAGIGQGIISQEDWNTFEDIKNKNTFGYYWLVDFCKQYKLPNEGNTYSKLVSKSYEIDRNKPNSQEKIKTDRPLIKKRIMMVLDPLSCILVANDDDLRKVYDLFEIENDNNFNNENWFNKSKRIKDILFEALKDEVFCENSENNKTEKIDLSDYKKEVCNKLGLNCEKKESSSKIGNDLLSKLKIIYNFENDCDICELTVSLLINKFMWYASQYSDFIDDKHKNLILHGPPGNGKTYLVKKFLDFKYPDNQDRQKFTKEIQFHPSYTYEDFIDGLKPVGVNSGQFKLDLVNGHFKQFCIEASKDLDNDYYFVVDEINRANLSSVFGELLTSLEYRAKLIKEEKGVKEWSNLIELQNSNLSNVLNKKRAYQEFAKDGDKFKFGIPENIYFIGMMNDVDKSIESFDLALRRRFKWKKMECDYDIITAILNYNNLSDYEELCKTFNKYISENRKDNLGLGKQYELGHSYFLKIEDYTKKRKDISNSHLNSLFDNHIEPILTEYLRLNYEEIEIESKISEAKKKFQFETSKNENNSNSNDNEINNE